MSGDYSSPPPASIQGQGASCPGQGLGNHWDQCDGPGAINWNCDVIDQRLGEAVFLAPHSCLTPGSLPLAPGMSLCSVS